MSILIVDDSRIMRNIVKAALKSLHYPDEAFLEAWNGDDAWALVESQKLELLLVDWNMPGLNGVELVKKIRGRPELRTLPIVMVTSEAAKYNMIEAVKAGVDEYVVKPVNEATLGDKIRRALNRSRS